MITLFLAFSFSNSFAVELSRRSLIQVLMQLFLKTKAKLDSTATAGLQKIGERILPAPIEEEVACAKALKDASTEQVCYKSN